MRSTSRVKTGKLRRERFGLSVVAIALLVAAVASAYLLVDQRDQRVLELRHQGQLMVQMLGAVPLERLAPGDRRLSVLDAVAAKGAAAELLFVQVSAETGEPLGQRSLSDRLPEPDTVAAEPSRWLGQRSRHDPLHGDVLEFYGPVLEHGQRVAQVRLAYRQPSLVSGGGALSMIALVVFALMALAAAVLFLVRREVRPIGAASAALEAVDPVQAERIRSAASEGALHDLSEGFSEAIQATRRKVQELETQHTDGLMSNKLLVYQKARIEAALQSLPEAVLVVDGAGVVTYANSRAGSVLGTAPEQLLGHTAQAWCSEPEVLALFASCQRDMARTYRGEAVQYTPAHTPDRVLAVSPHPLFAARGGAEQLGTLFVFRDVSDEVVAKRAKGEFVAHVAHELKTPLNVIQMYSETLQEDAGRTSELTVEATNIIHDEVERLSTLINNLLSMTQIEMGVVALDRQRARLHDLVNDVVENVRRAARGKDINFQLDVPQTVTAIAIDKDLLRIALNNLLTNAIKYNRPGGEVVVSVREDDQQVAIHIRDTGIGISPEDQEKIFDKFYRSDDEEVRQRSGHGLGLALAKQIVTLHHGDLSLSSQLGEGTEFVLAFDKSAGMFRQAI